MSVQAAHVRNEERATTRRRGVALQRAILDATVEELRATGFGRLTMEGIAARARTGKAALYRRWASKGDLVVAALQDALPSSADLPDHGDVRADVLDLLRQMQAMINSPAGCVVRALMSDADRDEAFVRIVHERVLKPRKQAWVTMLRRGVERGQVRPEAATPVVAEVGPCMLVHRYLTSGPPIPDSYLVSIVDDVIVPLLRR
ncbi:MAG TPA: TetR/AcrR family transcriptional regulator [Mycobacteriales bacterium]|nr:TetR/AcrR family transcriptional regulator [Mycobacteriales bacterium]